MFLQDSLHSISQVMMYPAIGMLLVMVGYALFSLGSLMVEAVRERAHFDVIMPRFLRNIQEAPAAELPAMFASSGLLRSQRKVLLTIYENRDLEEEGLWALAKRLLLQERDRRGRVVSRNDVIAKLAPMVGLMGTLIPLGPGIVAFGRGDGSAMASAMLIAFDTTVTGLVVAAVMLVVARVRRRWYSSYQASLEAGVTTLLERIGNMAEAERRANGEVRDQSAEVAGFGFEFTAEQGTQDDAADDAEAPAGVPVDAGGLQWEPHGGGDLFGAGAYGIGAAIAPNQAMAMPTPAPTPAPAPAPTPAPTPAPAPTPTLMPMLGASIPDASTVTEFSPLPANRSMPNGSAAPEFYWVGGAAGFGSPVPGTPFAQAHAQASAHPAPRQVDFPAQQVGGMSNGQA